jgi:hypothetical protein
MNYKRKKKRVVTFMKRLWNFMKRLWKTLHILFGKAAEAQREKAVVINDHEMEMVKLHNRHMEVFSYLIAR